MCVCVSGGRGACVRGVVCPLRAGGAGESQQRSPVRPQQALPTVATTPGRRARGSAPARRGRRLLRGLLLLHHHRRRHYHNQCRHQHQHQHFLVLLQQLLFLLPLLLFLLLPLLCSHQLLWFFLLTQLHQLQDNTYSMIAPAIYAKMTKCVLHTILLDLKLCLRFLSTCTIMPMVATCTPIFPMMTQYQSKPLLPISGGAPVLLSST